MASDRLHRPRRDGRGARAAITAGHPTTVWNRTAGEGRGLGARVAPTVEDAAQTPIYWWSALFDHRSVHEVLDPVADRLRGARIVNLTTTAPEGARELARWADGVGARYLDGGIMATPEMIGTPQSRIFCSAEQGASRRSPRHPRTMGNRQSISETMPEWPRCTIWRCSRRCT